MKNFPPNCTTLRSWGKISYRILKRNNKNHQSISNFKLKTTRNAWPTPTYNHVPLISISEYFHGGTVWWAHARIWNFSLRSKEYKVLPNIICQMCSIGSTEAQNIDKTFIVLIINFTLPGKPRNDCWYFVAWTLFVRLIVDAEGYHFNTASFHKNINNTLQWRHNERDGVSDHQPHDYLLNRCSGANLRKYQSSVSLAFVRGIHRAPVNSPHKGTVTRKMFPFDDVIMKHIARPRGVSSVSSKPGVSSVCLAIVFCALWCINGSCYWLKLGCILKIMSKTQDGCDYFLKKKI